MPDSPHILLFISDQHRADCIAAAGDPRVLTPHLDRLFREGASFQAAYCNSPVCGPSRMSLLTGQMPAANGVLTNRQALASHVPTLAHSLSAAGYDTVLCGRMHFIGPDQLHGFQERLVGDIGPVTPGFHETPTGPFAHTTGQHRDTLRVSGPGTCPSQLYDDEVVRHACDRLARQPAGKPLFLVIGTYGPHNPYTCRPDLYEHYIQALPRPAMEEIHARWTGAHPLLSAWRETRGMTELTAEELHRSRAAYYGMVEETDERVGTVLNAIDRMPGAENTLFAYLSDHGDMAGEHGMFWKSCFLEGSVRVPLVFRGKNILPGKQISAPVSLLDLTPTLCGFAEAPPPPHAEGLSLKDPLTLPRAYPPADRPVLSVLVDPKAGPQAMVRKGEIKHVKARNLPTPHCTRVPADNELRHDPDALRESPTLMDTHGPSPEVWADMERAHRQSPELNAFFANVPAPAHRARDQWVPDPAALKRL
ncbi:MAG: sulfatase-like hydrolase/transferase [Verrucomicrobia bacterium]|nr:sulfatase-like hydrolase/transferase [Verrucomicrobiota bacterium]MCH8527301.1 sulfatase-like hydrolase/transferase [Kiritimatiellia bacterium]